MLQVPMVTLERGDSTTDPALRSWIPVEDGSDFPIQNLPFGAFRHGADGAHPCIAIGDRIVDLRALASTGALDAVATDARALFAAPTLEPFLRAGRGVWRATRERLSELLDARNAGGAATCVSSLRPRAEVELVLPIDVPDYVDFYASLEHATNVGAILRPGTEPLAPNWRYVPIGYHGRSATVVIDRTPVVRPWGQIVVGDAPPVFMPTRALDFEMELGFVTGDGPSPPGSIAPNDARAYIFGCVLLNDWSARDIQAWEYRPLGPFLGKSFATSISPWIVTLDALEPFRVAGPAQDPPPLAHLATRGREQFDIALETSIRSAAMRERSVEATVLTRGNARTLYWSQAQQLAHATSNGARVRAGDLFGSGTISGSTPDSYGSMIELSWGGTRRVALPDGSTRAYLHDGDDVCMRGRCERRADRAGIGFGTLCGRIEPAPSPQRR